MKKTFARINIHYLTTKSIFFLLIFMFLFMLSGCQNQSVIRPTKHFYVNDYADILDEATIMNISREASRLFDDTNSYIHGGTKLVINTIYIDQSSDMAFFDEDTLLERWVTNNGAMGLVVNLYISEENGAIELSNTTFSMNQYLQQYISLEQIDFIIDRTLYHSNWDDSQIDLPVMHMYYELLEAIYIHVYDYISFTYDMEIYELYLNSFQGDDIIYKSPMTYGEYMLFQIGIESGTIVISYFIFMVIFMSIGYLMIRKDHQLNIIKQDIKK